MMCVISLRYAPANKSVALGVEGDPKMCRALARFTLRFPLMAWRLTQFANLTLYQLYPCIRVQWRMRANKHMNVNITIDIKVLI